MKNNFTIADLYDFIKDSFQVKEIPETIIKQINRYSLKYELSAKDIARCICYYEEVKKGVLDPLYGIWFVPNVKDAAAEYFRKLELDQQNQAAEAKKVVEYQDNNIIFNIKSLFYIIFNIKSLKHKKRQPIQLDITNVDIEGGSND